jgi:serralysin
MSAYAERQEGLFSGLIADTEADAAMGNWACACGWCSDVGAGGDLGAWGTTPTAQTYAYVAQAAVPVADDDPTATLVAGSKWSSVDSASGTTVISYSFVDPQSSTFSYGSLAAFANGVTAFSEADKQLTREILARIEAVCNVDFVEVADNAQQAGVVRYGYSQQPNTMNYAGYAFFPSTSAIGGDVWLGADQAQTQWDFYRPNLILHETLHAIGLKHPFAGGKVLSVPQDIIPNTVMSYSPVAGGSAGSMTHYPAEPMAYDVATLQQLYGASALNAGDTVYNLAATEFQAGFRALWDASGNDTLDAGGVATGVTLQLGAGGSSDIGVRIGAQANVSGSQVTTTYSQTLTIAQGARIENAAGSAFADLLVGTEGANRLEGRGGNDQIVGGEGLDTAVYAGARGNFVLAAAPGAMNVQDLSGIEGFDSLAGIERLQFADGGVALDLNGNAGVAAKILGAVFGPGAVANAQIVGQALDVLDTSGLSFQAAMDLALDLRLGTQASNAQVVNLLFTNVVGATPTAAQAQPFVDMLNTGAATHASLGVMAAEHALNLDHINFTGLAANGLAFA